MKMKGNIQWRVLFAIVLTEVAVGAVSVGREEVVWD